MISESWTCQQDPGSTELYESAGLSQAAFHVATAPVTKTAFMDMIKNQMKFSCPPEENRSIVTAKDVLLKARAALLTTTLAEERVCVCGAKMMDVPKLSLMSPVSRQFEIIRNTCRNYGQY